MPYIIPNLRELYGEPIVNAFEAIPPIETALDLSGVVSRIDQYFLKRGLQRIRATVETVDLGFNILGIKPAREVADTLSGLPPTVKTVNLDHNNFERLSLAELQLVLSAMPHVTTIHLKGNNLHQLASSAAVAEMLFSLPGKRKVFILSDSAFAQEVTALYQQQCDRISLAGKDSTLFKPAKDVASVASSLGSTAEPLI